MSTYEIISVVLDILVIPFMSFLIYYLVRSLSFLKSSGSVPDENI